MIQAARIIGIGLTTTGLATTGSVGLGLNSMELIVATVIISLVLAFILLMAMPGVRCHNCLKRGVTQWVLPGKHCPLCSTPC